MKNDREWLPIETARKDGVVQLRSGDDTESMPCFWSDENGWTIRVMIPAWGGDFKWSERHAAPTHWRPYRAWSDHKPTGWWGSLPTTTQADILFGVSVFLWAISIDLMMVRIWLS